MKLPIHVITLAKEKDWTTTKQSLVAATGVQ